MSVAMLVFPQHFGLCIWLHLWKVPSEGCHKKKSLGFMLILEEQVKVEKARLALPQFLVRAGEGGCGVLAVSWGDTY